MQKDSIILLAKSFVKQWPWFSRFLANYVDHYYEDYSSYKTFLKNNKAKRLKVNLGSGVTPAGDGFISVDFQKLPGVGLCADAHRLPFKDNSLDAVLCTQLIEHIRDPSTMVVEIDRVLKPGGEVYVTAPFMYPYHEAPIDLYRWSVAGLRQELQSFSPVRSGVMGGPTATLVEALHGWLAILLSFNSDRIFQLVYLILLPVLKPLKIIDLIILNKFKSSYRMASLVYFYGKKPAHPMN